MKDPYFIYFLDLVFLSIIILSFITINYQLDVQDKIKNKKQIQECLFDILVNIFLIFLFITFIIFTSKYGIKRAFLIWCILNLITPIPETGLMVSLPLKRFYDINLIFSQVFIVLFSIIAIYFSYNVSYFKTFTLGKLFSQLLKKNKILIFLSVICSLIGVVILQKEIDYYYSDKKFYNFHLLLATYLIAIVLYFYKLKF